MLAQGDIGANTVTPSVMMFRQHRANLREWRERLCCSLQSVTPCARDPIRSKAALMGDIENVFLREWLEDKKRVIRFFFSSTFSDTVAERNVIYQDVLPYLVECARNRGFDFIMAEACYGYGLDGREPIERSKRLHKKLYDATVSELIRCQHDSAGIFFILFTGDKYGFRHIPVRIPQQEFIDLTSQVNIQDGEVLNSCYRLDANSLAGADYTMHDDLDEDVYEKARCALRSAASVLWPQAEHELRDPSSFHRIKFYTFGIVEEEVSRGIFWVPTDRIPSGTHVFRRTFDVIESFEALESLDPTLENLSDFADISDGAINRESYLLLREQQHRMIPIALVAASHVDAGHTKYNALPWAPGGVGIDASMEPHRQYLSSFLDDLARTLLDSLDRAYLALAVDPDPLLDDCIHHLRLARDRHAAYLDAGSAPAAQRRIGEYLAGDGGRALVLHGAPGAGKTFAAAEAAHREACRARGAGGGSDGAVVVVRFVAESAGSATLRGLLHGLCSQLARVAAVASGSEGRAGEVPTSTEALRVLFREQLAAWPPAGRLCIFLDGVDQLDDSDGGRLLTWLPLDEFSPAAYLVVTTGPDDPMPARGRPYHGLSILRNRLPATDSFVAVGEWGAAEKLLEHLLKRRGRTITDAQRAVVLAAAGGSDGVQIPLFLTLAAARAATWASHFDDAAAELAPSVRGLVDRAFAMLLSSHAASLVAAVLSFITLARDGVSEVELRELLALDDDVLADQYRWTVPPARVLPTAALTVLLSDLAPYMCGRGGSGELLHWAHRQCSDAVAALFHADADIRKARHGQMSEFFSGVWAGKPKPYSTRLRECIQRPRFFPEELEGDRCVRSQPIVFSSSVWIQGALVNQRRCAEAAFHMLEACLWSDAACELCSFEGICARAKCGEGYTLSRQLADLDKIMRRHRSDLRDVELSKRAVRVQHYARWIRDNIDALVKEPEYEIVSSCSSQPLSSVARLELLSILPQLKREPFASNSWMLSLQVGVSHSKFSPEICTLLGHNDWVRSVSWSPDGQQLATASADKTIRIWDTLTGSQITILQGHADSVDSVTWSPDGKYLASSSCDRTALLWNMGDFSLVATFDQHTEWVSCVAWSPNSSRLATCSGDGTTIIWQISADDDMFVLHAHSDWINCVAWRPDGVQLATASSDESVCIWDVSSASPDAPLATIHCQSSVSCVAWRPDGKQLATTSDDRTYVVRIWDALLQVQVAILDGHFSLVTCVAWRPDGSQLATGSYDKTIRIWDASNCSQVSEFQGHSSSVTCVAWSLDGQHLASSSGDMTIKIWDSVDDEGRPVPTDGHNDLVYCVAWSPDGLHFASGSGDSTALIWNADTGLLSTIVKGHTAAVLGVAWSHDGRQLATAGADKTARLWKIVDTWQYATAAVTLWGHTDAVAAVTWSPDGMLVATAGEDAAVIIWDVVSGAQVAALPGHTSAVHSVAWSPDGHRISTASGDGIVRVWDAARPAAAPRMLDGTSGAVRSFAWSPDGGRLAAAADDTVRIWDMALDEPAATLVGHTQPVTCVAWAPDGGLLATASRDRTVRLWDAVSGGGGGHQVATLHQSPNEVLGVAWSPDGTRLATASGHASRVWFATSAATPWHFQGGTTMPGPASEAP